MSCISSFIFYLYLFLPVMKDHSVWEFGSQETGMMQPSVMLVNFVHIPLFLGGKGIQTKLTVIFLPLSTRRRSGSRTSKGGGKWRRGFKNRA